MKYKCTMRRKNRRGNKREQRGKLHLKINPIALRKAKIAYSFGLSECNRVTKHKSKEKVYLCPMFIGSLVTHGP